MNILVITQKVDIHDDIMGFFNGWVTKIAGVADKTYVISNYVGEVDLPENVILYSLGKEKGRSRLMRYIFFYYYLFKIITKVDGIFAHMCPEYVMASYPVAKVFRKKMVMWYSHARVGSRAGWAAKRVYKVVSSSRAGFVFDTDNLLETGHGIDTDVFKPAEKKSDSAMIRIFAISRISIIKNYETLIEAINILVNEKGVKNIEVKIAGIPTRSEDKEYLEGLKTKITEYGLEEYFNWLGSVSNRDTVPIYQNMDIFVRMQEAGGFGKTELEAMAVGAIAIVPTDVYKDLLGEFGEKLYFEAKNANSLAEKILETSKWSREETRKYSVIARDLVLNNHNLETLAKRIVLSFND